MKDRVNEWLKQSEYDLDTAKAMFDTGKFIYAVFMSHLSLEKALKACYEKKLKAIPPKTHDLILLIKKCNISIPEELGEAIASLDQAHLPTRYPEDLAEAQKAYDRPTAQQILAQTEKILEWITKLIG